jgi:hypothetical protein
MANLSAYYPAPIVAGTTIGTYADGASAAHIGQANTFTQNQTLNGTNNVAPNQTAASGSSLLTRDLGDARYTWPFRSSHIEVPASANINRYLINSPYAGANANFQGSGGTTGGPIRINCNTRFQNQIGLLLNMNTDATTALAGTFISAGSAPSNAIPFNKTISLWARFTSLSLGSNAMMTYYCGGRLGAFTTPGLGGYGFGLRVKGGASASALPVSLITANSSTSSGNVTGATNATPIVITSANHGLSTNDRVHISLLGGNTAANGLWSITVVDSNTFSLNNSVGNAAYTSGGSWTKILDVETDCGTINGLVVNELTATSNGLGSVTLSINGATAGSASGSPTQAFNNYDSWVVSIINSEGAASTSYADFHRAEILIQ